MRKAINKKLNITINVVEHIMTRNLWEFYITDNKHDDDIVEALVMGHETELGDISINSIKPFISMRTYDMSGLLPPEGYEWVK